MRYSYYIEAEVAGRLGENTILDTSRHPPIIKKFHYEFMGWMGDDLIETFPGYVVTERLRMAIENSGVTGIEFDRVEISHREECLIYSGSFDWKQPFYWAKVIGIFGIDDIALSKDFRMLVSEKAFQIIKSFNFKNANYEEYEE